eukprot:3311582-Rhodomonas_salina.1
MLLQCGTELAYGTTTSGTERAYVLLQCGTERANGTTTRGTELSFRTGSVTVSERVIEMLIAEVSNDGLPPFMPASIYAVVMLLFMAATVLFVAATVRVMLAFVSCGQRRRCASPRFPTMVCLRLCQYPFMAACIIRFCG